MRVIEIIEIRLARHSNHKLETEIEQVINDIRKDESGNTMKMYKKLNLNTDYMIIIVNPKSRTDSKSSYLGQRLKAALSDFGLINHTFWNEVISKSK